jgi:replicative DNA helicase
MSEIPHDSEAERAVLAAMLLDQDALRSVERLVSPQDFYDPSHAMIFEAMRALDARGVPIDLVTLCTELRHRERLQTVGGVQYIGELTDALATTAHVTSHAQIVADFGRTRRALVEIESCASRLRQGESLDAVRGHLERTLAREQRRAKGPSIHEGLSAMFDAWLRPSEHVETGLWQLDAILSGGLRAGDMIGIAGSAGGGKSVVVGQIALDMAKSGAVVVYASVEMPQAELLARWLALEAFRTADPHGDEWAMGYSEILYGRAWRGEGIDVPAQRHRVMERIERAREVLATTDRFLSVHQVAPGSTVEELRALLETARERAPRDRGMRPTVLIVDPLQRLFASAYGGRTGRAVESINANETERVGAVAQELKYLADTEGLAILFTSDTTKAAALGAISSAGSLRGSYQINHLATMVLGLHTGATPEALRTRLDGDKERDMIAPDWPLQRLQHAVPEAIQSRRDAQQLGARAALLECSKNRRGPAHSIAFGLVPGASCVLEIDRDIPHVAASMPSRARGNGRS